MAVNVTTYEPMTTGSAPSGEGITAVVGPVVSTANPMHGYRHMRISNPGTSLHNSRYALGGAQLVALEFYLCTSDLPTGETTVTFLSDTTDAVSNCAQVTIMPTTGYLRVRTKGTTRYTTTFSVCDGKYRRVIIYADAGTSATTGKIRMLLFEGDNLTATADSGVPSTGASPATDGIDVAGTAGGFGQWRLGKPDATSYAGTLDVDTSIYLTGTDAAQNPAPYSPAATSPVNPISVLANPGGWTPQGGAVTQAQAVSDGTDATFIRSAGSASNEVDTLRVPDVGPGNVTVTVRARIAPSSTATAVKAELLQDTTVIGTATFNASSTPALTTSWADLPFTVAAGSITDRTKLRVRLTGNAS